MRLAKGLLKCEACQAFNLFGNKLNKLNNTGARMFVSFDHLTLKLIKNCILA